MPVVAWGVANLEHVVCRAIAQMLECDLQRICAGPSKAWADNLKRHELFLL